MTINRLTLIGLPSTVMTGDILKSLGSALTKTSSHGATGVLMYTGSDLLITVEGSDSAISHASHVLSSHPSVRSVEVLARETSPDQFYDRWSVGMLATGVTPLQQSQINDVLSVVKSGGVALDAAYRAICLITEASVPVSPQGVCAPPTKTHEATDMQDKHTPTP